ncbi:Homeobox HD-10 [Lecanosticta acicola]|uniref:Homeobox HD-10 n=1 Tax=Lecanosticta acicola TaxID=111012 RepID=A0AAI8Z134_9PEZI|nr:Homeobox HD-10 [Lecanosticta acicola]
MVTEKYAAPLSPPNSPRMSDATARAHDYYSQHGPTASHYTTSTSSEHGQTSYESTHHYSYYEPRPALRSYKSFSQPTGRWAYDHPNQSTVTDLTDQRTSQSVHRQAEQQVHPGDSGPESPVDRLTPRSPTNSKEQHDDDELIDFGGDDQDEDADKPPMTAEEIRRQKRKMKRFRLTHNQTRFLMSEFARQAHPDAAHRERLAREIPGLSARQVQVWFQNRRAKLKRLTTDDRERVMRSRALPPDFDTTQALHSPFGAQHSAMGAPVSALGSYSAYGENVIRPLTLDTLRRVPDYEHYGHQQYAAPSGVSPALGAFAFTPPQSATDHLSPGSTASGMSPFVLQHQGSFDPSRRPPAGLAGSGPTSYAPQSSMPRLPLHDRFVRTTGEPTGSPLRTSVSYSALSSGGTQQPHHLERAASFSEHSQYSQQRPQLHRNVSNSSLSEQTPYGLGFSCQSTQSSSFEDVDTDLVVDTSSTGYPPSEQQQQTSVASGAQQATEDKQYRRSGLPSATYDQYAPSTFNTTQSSHYPAYAAHYPSQNFPGAYRTSTDPQAQQQAESSTSYQPLPAGHQPYMHYGGSNGNQVTDSHANEPAVSIPPSY